MVPFGVNRISTIQLFLPSFSIAEAIKTLERLQSGWKDLSKQLKRTLREVKRSALTNEHSAELERAIDVLGSVHDKVETSFWSTLENVGQAVRIVEPTPQILRLTAEIRDFLELTPADSAVLATVVALKKAGKCSAFMSRDKSAFGSDAIQTYMKGEGITYFDSLHPIVGPRRPSTRTT